MSSKGSTATFSDGVYLTVFDRRRSRLVRGARPVTLKGDDYQHRESFMTLLDEM